MPVAEGEGLGDGDVGPGAVQAVIGVGGGGVLVQIITLGFVGFIRHKRHTKNQRNNNFACFEHNSVHL